jgi:hypothetical protein
VTPVSGTAVRQTNDVINGNDPSSNASVNEEETMPSVCNQDITLPKEEWLRVKDGTVLYSWVYFNGHAKLLGIILD